MAEGSMWDIPIVHAVVNAPQVKMALLHKAQALEGLWDVPELRAPIFQVQVPHMTLRVRPDPRNQAGFGPPVQLATFADQSRKDGQNATAATAMVIGHAPPSNVGGADQLFGQSARFDQLDITSSDAQLVRDMGPAVQLLHKGLNGLILRVTSLAENWDVDRVATHARLDALDESSRHVTGMVQAADGTARHTATVLQQCHSLVTTFSEHQAAHESALQTTVAISASHGGALHTLAQTVQKAVAQAAAAEGMHVEMRSALQDLAAKMDAQHTEYLLANEKARKSWPSAPAQAQHNGQGYPPMNQDETPEIEHYLGNGGIAEQALLQPFPPTGRKVANVTDLLSASVSGCSSDAGGGGGPTPAPKRSHKRRIVTSQSQAQADPLPQGMAADITPPWAPSADDPPWIDFAALEAEEAAAKAVSAGKGRVEAPTDPGPAVHSTKGKRLIRTADKENKELKNLAASSGFRERGSSRKAAPVPVHAVLSSQAGEAEALHSMRTRDPRTGILAEIAAAASGRKGKAAAAERTTTAATPMQKSDTFHRLDAVKRDLTRIGDAECDNHGEDMDMGVPILAHPPATVAVKAKGRRVQVLGTPSPPPSNVTANRAAAAREEQEAELAQWTIRSHTQTQEQNMGVDVPKPMPRAGGQVGQQGTGAEHVRSAFLLRTGPPRHALFEDRANALFGMQPRAQAGAGTRAASKGKKARDMAQVQARGPARAQAPVMQAQTARRAAAAPQPSAVPLPLPPHVLVRVVNESKEAGAGAHSAGRGDARSAVIVHGPSLQLSHSKSQGSEGLAAWTGGVQGWGGGGTAYAPDSSQAAQAQSLLCVKDSHETDAPASVQKAQAHVDSLPEEDDEKRWPSHAHAEDPGSARAEYGELTASQAFDEDELAWLGEGSLQEGGKGEGEGGGYKCGSSSTWQRALFQSSHMQGDEYEEGHRPPIHGSSGAVSAGTARVGAILQKAKAVAGVGQGSRRMDMLALANDEDDE